MANAPGINLVPLIAARDPNAASKLLQSEQQQALAQQLMDQGAQQENTAQLANPGGMVVPLSPLGLAAKALEKGLGGYEQRQAIQNQMNAYRDMSGPSTNANGQGVPQASNGPSSGNLFNDPQFMSDALIVGPDEAYKGYLARTSPTDLAKNIGNPMTAPYMNKDLLTTGVGGVPMPTSAILSHYGSSGGSQTVAPKGTTTDVKAAMSELYGENPPPPNDVSGFPGPKGGKVDLQPAAKYDPFNPNANEQNKGLIEGDQKYLNETLLPAKDAAVAANNNLDALKNAAAIANANDITRTGPTDPKRVEFAKYLNDFASAVDGKPPVPANELAAADTINKIGLRLTANMTKMLGSREAAQIFVKIQEANPNWYMQPQTLNLVTNLIKAENDTAIGKYNAGFKFAKSGALAQDGVNAYEEENPGEANVKNAFAASGMAGFSDPNDPAFSSLPPGSKFYDLMPNSPSYGQQLVKH